MTTGAWCAWVGMVGVVALATTNPFYLAIILLGVILVAVLAPKSGHEAAGLRALFIFGIGLLAISVGIATINGNYGDHILFTIPGPEFPWWFGGLHLGGPVSAEGLVAAAIRGLAILCVLLAFGVFNSAVSPHQVLRTTPAALFHAGLVVTVGLTLLPASVEDIRRVREMRALRGAPGGLRELPALVVPAVIGGLERSMRLAEAMEARGYASAPPPPRAPRLIGALSAPLLLAAASFWYYYPELRALAAAALVLAVAASAYWACSATRTRRTTRLHHEPMSAADRIGVAFSAAVALFAIASGSFGWVDLGYNPFAGLPQPAFELRGSLVALACAWPAVRLTFAPAPASSLTEAESAPATTAVQT
ncbi:MAG: energy-coupling factor transporter transmembrane component T [Hyphomicrobiales bacterium]